MIYEIKKQEYPEWLRTFQPGNDTTPPDLATLLTGSLFGPSPAYVISDALPLAGNTHSFIFQNTGHDRELILCWLENDRDRVPGYHVIYKYEYPLALVNASEQNAGVKENGPVQYAIASIWERNPQLNSEHGPERLSILYVFGEIGDVYRNLFCHYRKTPRFLMLEEQYRSAPKLKQVLLSNRTGMPHYLAYNLNDNLWQHPFWTEYIGYMVAQIPSNGVLPFTGIWKYRGDKINWKLLEEYRERSRLCP
jgi:hypothetical protein